MNDGQWTPDPDFNRLPTSLLRQGEPDRVPLHDSVDVSLRGRAHVMIGGAPVDDKFAREIGADFYGDDAPGGSNQARDDVTASKA